MRRNPHAVKLGAAIVVGIATFPAVHAFEGWEHEHLGDLAFHLALRMHCPSDAPATDDCAALQRGFTNRFEPGSRWPPQAGAIRYGTITRCVDFFLTPEKMLADREDVLFDPPSEAVSPPAAADSGRQGILPRLAQEYRRLDFERHCSESFFNTSGMQAAHSNHTHFQAELVASQHLYHAQAIATRRPPRSNLFGALLINAIADHYLHDFFAPGHVGTFRSHMSDIYSNALHDSINASGARLRFSSADFRQLLAHLERGGSGSLEAVRLDDPALRAALMCAPAGVGSFLRPLTGTTCTVSRLPPEPCWLHGVVDLGSLLRKATVNEAGCDAPRWEEGFVLNGDNMLWRPSQWRQRLVMLAMQMLSILEVLRADRHGDEPSAFAGAYWRAAALPDRQGASIETSLDGRLHYRLRFLTSDQLTVLPGRDRKPLPDESAQDVIEIAGYEPGYLWLRPRAGRQIVISAGANYETPRFGKRLSRTSLSLEMPVTGFLGEGRTKSNIGVAVGGLWFNEDEARGWGLSLRPGMVFTQTETFLSFPYRRNRYSGLKGDAWHSAWGVRLDQGFSSFMTVFLEATHTSFVQSRTPLQFERGWAIGAGIVLAAPLCRIPLLGRHCD